MTHNLDTHTHTHTHTHTPGRTPLNQQSARHTDGYLHNTQNKPKGQTFIPSEGLRNPSNQATADPSFRPQGQWDWHRSSSLKLN